MLGKTMAGCILILAAGALARAGLSTGEPAGPDPAAAGQTPAAAPAKVYGEWRIRIKPDEGVEYNRLIREKGLPLFKEAGGRMVGWWATLIGDLYEHVTIWEYDGMGAFEKAVQFLSGDERFARFAGLRDPLLAGEESRFLALAPGAEAPALPETSRYIIQEVHRVPLEKREAYLRHLESGMALLKAGGFRPAGPWITRVGRWSEITFLFRFNSLEERETLLAAFEARPEGRAFNQRLLQLADDVVSRLLVPAPLLKP